MNGKIDTSFSTEQRDLFASGVVAEIGVNAYAVWSAIKFHADNETGKAWPGMRRIGELVGLSKSSVDRAIVVLINNHMLRVTMAHGKRRGQTYIARERMTVRLGSRILCTIVIDYIPGRMRGKVQAIEKALESGKDEAEAFADAEIIPGEGFAWNPETKRLMGRIGSSDLPLNNPEQDDHYRAIGALMLNKNRLPKK